VGKKRSRLLHPWSLVTLQYYTSKAPWQNSTWKYSLSLLSSPETLESSSSRTQRPPNMLLQVWSHTIWKPFPHFSKGVYSSSPLFHKKDLPNMLYKELNKVICWIAHCRIKLYLQQWNLCWVWQLLRIYPYRIDIFIKKLNFFTFVKNPLQDCSINK